MTSLLGSATPGVMYPGLRFGPSPGLPAGPTVSGRLLRAVVDTHVHLPDMFELTFRDNDGSLVDDANLAIGTSVEVIGAKPDGSSSTSLISGEVTSIEAICAEGQILTIVRGYERAHRLQRGKHTKTFTGMRDSEIAAQVAQSAGLIVGDIDTSQVTHTHIAQIVQTDWDFLTDRAREIGFETGVVGGKFFFRKASGAAAGGGLGGALGSVVSAVAGALGLSSTLTFNENLRTFLPRVSGADLTTDVEVRVWDGEQARVVSAKTSTASGTATITGTQPGTLASTMTGGLSLGSIPTSPPPPVYTPLPLTPVASPAPRAPAAIAKPLTPAERNARRTAGPEDIPPRR